VVAPPPGNDAAVTSWLLHPEKIWTFVTLPAQNKVPYRTSES